MSPQFRVTLTKEEVGELQKISSTGSRSAKIVLFARALLLLDKGPHTTEHWTVNQTSKAVGLSERTLNHLKEKFVSQGLDSIIGPKLTGKSKRPVIFDGAFEAKLTQLACSEPPEGRTRWTVRLLADKLVELEIVEKISPMTVQRVLKKTNLSLT